MLFLTGAQSSLKKSEVAPQADPQRSLGGYVSSSPVPNAALNELFDLVSTGILSDRPAEVIALGLINQLTVPVTNVRLSIVVGAHPICEWRVGATTLNESLQMESIPNRYSEPIGAQFYDATFQRAAVEFELKGEPLSGDRFLLLPMNLNVKLTENGVKGFWNGLKNACTATVYVCERVADRRFRVAYSNEKKTPEEGIECRCVKNSVADIEFLGKFVNGETWEVILVSDGEYGPKEQILPGEGIGLWLKRSVSPDWEQPSDEELIEMKKRGAILPKVEQAEIVITYDKVK